MMGNGIEVSIICNAYNHGSYIRKALESFVMQKTTFKYEILVHDDASTDNTAEIIREFENKYPDLIKPIYQTENQYSKGNGMVGRIQWARVQGKYIAMCEGDDYWTDPLKLQKQYDAMERHPELDMCAHRADKVRASDMKLLSELAPCDHDTVLSVEQVILGGGGYVATNSLFYRSDLSKTIPEFRKKLFLDYTLQIQGSLRGGMLYLNDNMSVYRFFSKGSWTSNMYGNVEKAIEHQKKVYECLEVADKETEGRYTAAFQEKLSGIKFNIMILQKEYGLLKEEPYKSVYRKLSAKEKVKLRIKQFLAGATKNGK